MIVDKYDIAAVIVPRSMFVCILPRGIFRDTAPHGNFSSSAPLQHMPPLWPDALIIRSSGLYILGGVTYPDATSTARYKSVYEKEDV
jgi:hypothetical protein